MGTVAGVVIAVKRALISIVKRAGGDAIYLSIGGDATCVKLQRQAAACVSDLQMAADAMAKCLALLGQELTGDRAQALCDELVSGGGEGEESITEVRRTIDLMGAVGCGLLAACAAGLTMGVVSLDEVDLRVKARCGSDAEKGYALRLLPLIEHQPHHQLLVTLLLLNALANEALPLFIDELVPGLYAILISVTVVLFVGEIIPAAIFTGPSKLKIAASLSGVVWCVLWLLTP